MALDTSFYRSSFSRMLRDEGRAEGRAEGAAEGRSLSLDRILDKRGIMVSAEQRTRVLSCDDLDQLDEWIERAATATCASEVFDAD